MTLIRGTLVWSLVSLAIILAIGIPVAGWRGGLAGSLGVALTDMDLVTLGLFSNVLVTQQPGIRTIRLCLLFLLMKLPVLVAAVVLATRLGSAAVGCFLGGIGLVYFALVHVAIRGAGSRQRTHFHD